MTTGAAGSGLALPVLLDAALGVPIGLLLAGAVSRIMAGQLPIVNTFDIAGYLGAVGIIVAACLAASIAPSQHAARIEPMQALSEESGPSKRRTT